MKILSDSTLRHAEQVGLRADVLCMTGAGIGNLANALRDDPKIIDHGAVGESSEGENCTKVHVIKAPPLQQQNEHDSLDES